MPTAPYPVLEDVVEAARVRLNDAIIAGGDVLTDTASFTAPIINLAYQKFQQELVGYGYQTLEEETIVPGLSPVSSVDPASQVSLSWLGYNPGSGLQAGLALPQSLIRPKKLWERPTLTNNVFIEMSEQLNGLAAVPKAPWSDQWEWRADSIYMPGTTVLVDLRIRFAKFLADFMPAATTPFTQQVVPIMRSTDALAGFIAYEMSAGRGDVDAATLLANAKESTMIVVGIDSVEGRSTKKDSERSKMRDRYTPGGQAA